MTAVADNLWRPSDWRKSRVFGWRCRDVWLSLLGEPPHDVPSWLVWPAFRHISDNLDPDAKVLLEGETTEGTFDLVLGNGQILGTHQLKRCGMLALNGTRLDDASRQELQSAFEPWFVRRFVGLTVGSLKIGETIVCMNGDYSPK